MKTLVTGALGFVGRHLAPALAAGGHEVTGFVERGAADRPSSFRAIAEGDVLDAASVAATVAAASPSWVVHLAGQSSAAISFEKPVDTYRLNVIGTRNVLDAVRDHAPRARVLVIGSGEAYGPQPEGSRVAESAPFHPVSPYAASKAAADAVAEAAARRDGLDVVRTRSFGHTGPGQSPTFAIPSFARQIAAIEAGRAEPVLRVGNLDVTRDLTDVRDVALGYVALLERGRRGAAYNVCRGEGVRLSDVVRAMVARSRVAIRVEMVARSRVAIRVEVDPARMRPADLPWLVGDGEAMARDTGWRPAIPFERTLDDVIADARTRGD
ncbi:MAG: GDP-mannose 4,6-dehydratase [Candidatus Eisenbacteria bacterium]|nr:GDP-mannose 4,6-dehydratase [Candidatus Eisenbacteria bacterium]